MPFYIKPDTIPQENLCSLEEDTNTKIPRYKGSACFFCLLTITGIHRHILNNRIRAEKVRVIDKDGENIGVMVTSDAISKAMEDDLDLVLAVPDADPPIAKIVDFDKYRYQQEKEARKQKQRQQELKHIRFSARSAENDMQTQVKKIEKFLAKGDRVEIILRLRGRERGNKEWAKMRLDTFLNMIETEYKVIAAPKFAGMGMIMQIVSK